MEEDKVLKELTSFDREVENYRSGIKKVNDLFSNFERRSLTLKGIIEKKKGMNSESIVYLKYVLHSKYVEVPLPNRIAGKVFDVLENAIIEEMKEIKENIDKILGE